MPIQRMEVKAPAAPRTPRRATETALRRCVGVAVGKGRWVLAVVVLCGFIGDGRGEGGEEKKDVGRAMRKTPKRDMREAYCDDLVKGSLRKR